MTNPINQPTVPQSTMNEPFSTRCQRVIHVAKDLFQRNPDWVTFFREVLGVNGAARDQFRTNEEYLRFEQTDEYSQIQQMVSNLRSRKIPGAGHNEPTRVITVRLPESVHEALKVEASDHKTSMNKLPPGVEVPDDGTWSMRPFAIQEPNCPDDPHPKANKER